MRRVLGVAAAIVLLLTGATVSNRLIDERSRQDELASIINDPASRHIPLRGVPGQDTGAGTIGIHVSPSGDAVLDARSLRGLDPSKTYELWFLEGGDAHRAATFDPDDAGAAQVRFRAPIASPDLLGVTVEPEGGRDTPTMPIVFQGEA